MKIIFTAALLILLAACHSAQGPAAPPIVTDLRTQGPVDPLHARMDSLLQAYYRLKNDMVIFDTVGADSDVILISGAIRNMPLDSIRDTSKKQLAQSGFSSLEGELEGFTGEHSNEGKLEEFQMISDITYDLIKTVGLKYQTVYRQFCPMAFNDKGAYWLSDRQKIENPYLGKKMPDCGEVRETMKY